jgi:hypothetical protein
MKPVTQIKSGNTPGALGTWEGRRDLQAQVLLWTEPHCLTFLCSQTFVSVL